MDRVPELSVIMATYNRAQTLRTTLDCLAKQDLPAGSFEVIVIDDGSPDNTPEVVEELSPGLPFELTFLRHENHGPGYTQNRGIRAARGPLLLLMADDIFLDPGALRAHLETHRAHPEREVAVLGKVLQSPALDQSVFLKTWDPFGFQDFAGAVELPWYKFWACNVSLKRDFMVEHGMFLDHRGRGGAAAHEDVEVGYRLAKHGLRVLYSEAASGFHYHVVSLEQAIHRYYERGLNWGEFRAVVPDPELTVDSHVLNLSTLRDHVKVLRGPNSLRGGEKLLWWHVVRQGIRMLTFNRLTVALLWKPLLDRAETNPRVAKLVNRQLYRVFLYYHFLRGIHAARVRYGEQG